MKDIDSVETLEWLEALESVLEKEGMERVQFLLSRLSERATREGAPLPYKMTTPYRNTIPVTREARLPGDIFLERRIRSLVRWNALAMVLRANAREGDLGGHISSFSSCAALFDVGFNHFFRASTDGGDGDLIYFQGHSSPGIYARSFLEGRLTEEDMDNFRREVGGKGLSSYPHPWLMPDYWQFPTVSMGLGPIQAIYQAHVMKYMDARGLIERGDRRVWAFLGDGECDEPESLGAIALAGRENLDNLTFVINCNLQRLDGPVRGNGKIIQELEGVFRGAGWHVIKVVWGGLWDGLFKNDKHGLLQRRMDEVVDGELQNCKANGGAYTREHFFGTDPELLKLVEHLSDDDIYALNRGGHDSQKVYAAYHAAVHHQGQPTVVLAQTVKGYGFGPAGEARNTTHSLKKLDFESLRLFRDRFAVPLSDEALEDIPYFRPAEDSPEIRYLKKRREALGGYLPRRAAGTETLKAPTLELFKSHLEGSGGREISTTMAFVRMLSSLTRDKVVGERIVPIVPDEARTFGMEGMFRQLGIYTSEGQKYVPQDRSQIMYYREDRKGQILEEGINEAGAFSAWMAAATSYSHNNCTLVPFYIFYSMFGFQRVGDLAWAAGDMQARGFLIGGTSGRTTLNGEGLQHQDGHSHILAGTIPNCRSYDPAYAYELAVIIQYGIKRMVEERRNEFYYITTMNENYVNPAMPNGASGKAGREDPAGVAEGIVRGMYLLQQPEEGKPAQVQLLGSGAILNEVVAGAQILAEEFSIAASVWSVTSFNELYRDGSETTRWNLHHPEDAPRQAYVAQCLAEANVPAVASTDYTKLYAEQVRAWVPVPYQVLGTDGFGRSDTRPQLRRFFEVDRHYVVIAALSLLAAEGVVSAKQVAEAMSRYGIEAETPSPLEH